MSGFTPLVKKTYVFEGDDIEIQFKRLKRKHMIKMFEPVQQYSNKVDAGEDVSTETISLLNIMMDFGEEYIVVLQGLKDTEGNDISKAELFNETYFLEIASEVMMDILEASLGPLAKTSGT